MKVKSLALLTIITVATLSFADGVATNVYKGTKAAGRTTGKVAEKTVKGTAHGTEDVAKGTGKVAKATGHGVKTATVKTVDVLK